MKCVACVFMFLLVLCVAAPVWSVSETKTETTSAKHGAAPVQDEVNYTGIWEGRCLFSRVEAHVRHEGDRIHGVALVHTILGEVNPYHFKGRIRDGKIQASHFRGHRFEGEIVSEDEVSGSITTAKKGHVFKLDAERVSETPTRE